MGWDEKPADALQDMGALAAQVIMDQDAMEMVKEYMALEESDRRAVRDYMRLSELDRYTLQLVMASMGSNKKATDAGASVAEAKKSLEKADCNM